MTGEGPKETDAKDNEVSLSFQGHWQAEFGLGNGYAAEEHNHSTPFWP